MAKYECNVCKAVLDEGVSSCPICGASSEQFRVLGEQINIVSRRTSASDNYDEWNNWREMPIGHDQAITAMQQLLEHTDIFKKDLRDARTEWQNAVEHSQQIYNGVTAVVNKECEDEKVKFENEYKSMVSLQESRKATLKQVYDACSNFVEGVPSDRSGGAKQAARSGFSLVDTANNKVKKALDEKKKAYMNLRNSQIIEADRLRDEKIDRARMEQIDRDNQAEQNYESKSRSINESKRNDIAKGFGKEIVRTYAQSVLSARFNAASYECPTEIPECIMIGKIGATFPMAGQEEQAVIQALEAQAGEFCEKVAGEYTVLIPYAQRLMDGISLLMRYTANDREYVQNMIQLLLLKVFMSFPAGKLEATMIDPLELGASFPDIPKLAEGPNSARIIDTKIWSKEKDIETAIATLRQRLENMTQAYGGDKESRLKKEVVRALAITDFPVGFNDAALKDLQAIVRNASSLGVCVLICANDDELNKLKQKNGALVDEIIQSVIETRANGNKLMFVEEQSNRIFLQLDDMHDVIERKDTILSMMSEVIEHMQGKIEPFDSMFKDDIYDSNNWFTGNHDEIAVPIGIKGANTIVKMVLGRGGGSTEHHALIAGQTGAGKSTLLHTLIMSTMISYSPDEVQMYLLDFKEGVEFSSYTKYRLPSLRVVAINSEREFGLSVLKELCAELESRTKHFTRYGVSDIGDYVKLTDVPKVPKLMLIFDEVQELFRSGAEGDSIAKDCLSCLNKLVMQGRALGIHIILACQDFHNCTGLEAYFSQMAIRIAVKGSEEGAASILAAGNEGIKTLQNQSAGAAIYNGGGGVESANNFFQVSFIKDAERIKLLENLDRYYTDPTIAYLYEDKKTRVLMSNAEDDIHNCFNQFILKGSSTIESLASKEDGYGLLLGQGFGKKSIFMPEIRKKNGENILVVTKEEKMALSMFILSAMSVLYEELHTQADKTNALVYVIDLFADELTDGECDFDYLEDQFPQQVTVVKIGEAEELISSVYNTMISRADNQSPSTERIFLMFFGVNRARKLRNVGMYDNDQNDDMSAIDKLLRIFRNGPVNGINSILWGESHAGIELMLGQNYDSYFSKRIAYGLDKEIMNFLVAEDDVKSLTGKTAVYMDINNDVKNTHFRPYDTPAKVWVERYAEVYDRVINEGGI